MRNSSLKIFLSSDDSNDKIKRVRKTYPDADLYNKILFDTNNIGNKICQEYYLNPFKKKEYAKTSMIMTQVC